MRTLTAALKRPIKTVTGYIFYHTKKNITNEKTREINLSMLFLKSFKDAKFVVDGNALMPYIYYSVNEKLLSNASCASRFKQFILNVLGQLLVFLSDLAVLLF